MDDRSLACFIAVAQTLNFRRAAQGLHLTQPALSARIRGLEVELGVSLFERDRRHVALTPAGQALLPHARAACANIEEGKLQAQRAARGEAGGLRVGFTVLAMYDLVPHCVREFRERFPSVEIELSEMNSPALEAALVSGAVDVAILHPPLHTSGLEAVPLVDEPLVLALPSAHPLARRKVIPVRDLRDEPILIAPRSIGPSIFDRIIALFLAQGFSPRIVQEVTPMTSLVGLVSAGVGMGLVTRGLARLPRPGVSYRPLRPEAPRLPFAFAWRGPLSPTGRRFLETVKRGVQRRVPDRG
ncbi:LysR family transcriptional regulator [Myxococcus stipitatus]|uniref:LysR family transcriptional regulator n=1 Tax=Myxococcus stipitatus TaxID=83455 RepID=UPI001F296F04|nr:LysR family transcriptional regulator [Myxococcus stipitatus]MCE9671212.1 LysR family transcriptional regulator [Myxococcus stipitatus]